MKVESVKPPPPFPKWLQKQKEEACYQKFINFPKQVHINLLFVDVFQGVPNYAKYIKYIMENKNLLIEYATVALTEKYNQEF